jgi:hypothetical protein
VSKTLQDMIPKFLMHIVVNQTKVFIKEDLLACLYREAGKEDLMEENAAETQRRMETMGMYVCKYLLSFASREPGTSR